MPTARSYLLSSSFIGVSIITLGLHSGHIPPLIGVFGFALITAVTCSTSIQHGFALVVLINPFYIILRNAHPESVPLSGIRTLLISILYGFLILRILTNRIAPKISNNELIISSLALASFLCFIFPFSVSPSLTNTILGIREHLYIIPLSIFLVYLNRLENINLRLIINAFFFPGILITILHLLVYFDVIGDLHSLLSEKVYHQRQLIGLLLPRMSSYIGHGPSGVALYFASLIPVALYRIQYDKTISNIFYTTCIIMLVIATCLCLSFTGILCIAISFSAYAYSSKSKISIAIRPFFFVCAAVMSWMLLIRSSFLSSSFLEYLTSASEIVFGFLPQTLEEWMFGTGWHLASGAIIDKELTRQVDAGWMGVLSQFGILGFCIILAWFSYLCLHSTRLILKAKKQARSQQRQDLLTIGTIPIVCILSLHEVTFVLRPSDFNFIIFSTLALTSLTLIKNSTTLNDV